VKLEIVICFSSEKPSCKRSLARHPFNVLVQLTFEIQMKLSPLVGYSENEEFVAPVILLAGVLQQLDLEYWFQRIMTETFM